MRTTIVALIVASLAYFPVVAGAPTTAKLTAEEQDVVVVLVRFVLRYEKALPDWPLKTINLLFCGKAVPKEVLSQLQSSDYSLCSGCTIGLGKGHTVSVCDIKWQSKDSITVSLSVSSPTRDGPPEGSATTYKMTRKDHLWGTPEVKFQVVS